MFNDNCCNNLKSGDDLAGLLGDTPLSRDTVTIRAITDTSFIIHESDPLRRIVKIFIEEATDKVYFKLGGTVGITLNNASFPAFKNHLITISNSQVTLRLLAICPPEQSATLRISVAIYDPTNELP